MAGFTINEVANFNHNASLFVRAMKSELDLLDSGTCYEDADRALRNMQEHLTAIADDWQRAKRFVMRREAR